MFIGRTKELSSLKRLKMKNTASLVCLLGRRRIGKSTLIDKFSNDFKNHLSFQGLGPDEKAGKKEQLENFSRQLSEQTKNRQKVFNDWGDAFEELWSHVQNKEILILFDEISWMARGDELFAAKIKDAWDRKFKKNDKLILVLCGSVSTWLQDNILTNTNYEGRVSLRIDLQELDLISIHKFWENKNYKMSSLEKLLILSITGGVPKYLEEVLSSESAENNILKLCYNPQGLLFNDYKYIFKDVLGRRAESLDRIIRYCLMTKITPIELSKKLNLDYSSSIKRSIEILELSGFLSRDFYFKPDGEVSKLSHLRVKDNYLRFYIKFIEPYTQRILKGGKKFQSLSEIKNFEGILGLQFENLILHNRDLILKILEIPQSQLISSAPYRQNKTRENKGACQIDLLIHTNLDVFYLCEIKCKKTIDKSVIREVTEKLKILKLPRRSAVKPVLIYEGELYPPHREEIEDLFYKVISFSDLLQLED